jgi:hypothetical protein
MAATLNAPLVAAELGHTSPHLLYNTYRELVRPDEAERYWNYVDCTNASGAVQAGAAGNQSRVRGESGEGNAEVFG